MAKLLDRYEISDFDQMQFPVHLLKGKVQDAYPEFSKFPEFKLDVDEKDKVLKYIVFMYDKNSPIRTYTEGLERRKAIAARLAGFESKNSKFSEPIRSVMLLLNWNANKMIVRYVRMQRSLEFSLITAGLENFFALLFQLSKPAMEVGKKDILDVVEKRQKLFDQCRTQVESLRKLSETMFSDSRMVEIVDEIVQDEEPIEIAGGLVEYFAEKQGDDGHA